VLRKACYPELLDTTDLDTLQNGFLPSALSRSAAEITEEEQAVKLFFLSSLPEWRGVTHGQREPVRHQAGCAGADLTSSCNSPLS
jgi:hypothetical protein